MKAPPFGYRRVESGAEAVAALGELGSEARILAGGQSLLPMLSIRLAAPSHLIDIGRAADLAFVTADNGSLAVGAGARQWTVEHDQATADGSPLLVDAIGRAGQVPIRHRGTVVGSIAHADPSAEIPTAFLAHGGTVVIDGTGGERTVAADDFFGGPYMTAVDDGEMVKAVHFDRWPDGTGHAFQEFSHGHESWPVVTAAVLMYLDDGVIDRLAIAMSGVGGRPVRASAVEQELIGQTPSADDLAEAAQAATSGLEPFSDVYGSASYRKRVAGAMVKRALTIALDRSGGAQ